MVSSIKVNVYRKSIEIIYIFFLFLYRFGCKWWIFLYSRSYGFLKGKCWVSIDFYR
jgi:hypothetical protein